MDQIESICRQQIKLPQMLISVFDIVEKIVGKKKILVLKRLPSQDH